MTLPLSSPPTPIVPRLHVVTQPGDRPVSLSELQVSVEISGALAITTWQLTFENPNNRPLEGQLEFPLLAGQTIVRFAMDVDGHLRDAVPVPKDRGRQIFEEVVRRDADPGLLEKTEGDSYRARIYPILPKAPKRVLIAYQEALIERDGAPHYRLALDLPTLHSFTLRLAVRGRNSGPRVVADTLGLRMPSWPEGHVLQVIRNDFTAHGALELALAPRDDPAVTTQRRGEHTYFRAEQPLDPRTRPRLSPRTLGIVWDASGSGSSRDRSRELDLLGRYLRSIPGAVTVLLVRLRDTAEPAERFTIHAGDWSSLRGALETTEFDGASGLAAWRPDPDVDAWLLFSDGLFNYGPDHDHRPATGGAPIHTIVSTARADSARLRSLAGRSGGEHLDLLVHTPAYAAALLTLETERLWDLRGDPDELAELYPTVPSPLPGSSLVVAGILRRRAATLVAHLGFLDDPAGARTVTFDLRADDEPGQLAAQAWAALKIAALEPEYRSHADELARLGREFGIVTRDTSLIILESPADYAKYDIAPPADQPALHAAYELERSMLRRAGERRSDERLANVLRMYGEYLAWWERDFSAAPTPEPSTVTGGGPQRSRGGPAELVLGEVAERRHAPPAARPAPAPAAPPPMPARAAAMPAMSAPEPDASAAMSLADGFGADEGAPGNHGGPGSAGPGSGGPQGATIELQKWSPDAPYLARLQAASDDELLRVYLAERPAYARSTAFFLDVADLCFERGRPELGLRILSNLAELELESPAILRILGYRLLQADRPDLARPIFARVRGLRPEEPQSHRDLAQACAALREHQAAVDLLWQVVTGTWDGRFPEIELMALVELNALVARSPAPLELKHIDPRLLRHTPLDLRVVLTWDADLTDIDLWVTDPAGEKAYYGNRLTRCGGRVSPDFREGYGPEDFSLRAAPPGSYLVEANYYGNRQQIIAGTTTIQLQFFTGFARPDQHEQRITMRLREAREVVTVGRFTVG